MRKPRIVTTLCLLVFSLAFGIGQASAECAPSQVHEADLAYNQAVEFLKAGNYDEAIPRLSSVLDICAEHIPTLDALARAYKGAKRYGEARAAYEVLIEQKGDQASGRDYGSLGNVLARLKLYPDARAALIKAQILEPDDCMILYNLGVAYYAVQDYRKAVETLEEGVDKCPDIRENLLPQLAKSCEKAAAKERTLGNEERAVYYTGKHRQYAGEAGGTTAYDQVRQLMRAKDYAAAVPILDQMLGQDPDRKSALLSMARCKSALGQAAQAIPYYERYLVHAPDDNETTGELIRSLIEVGNAAKAISTASAAEGRFQAMGRRYLAPIYYGWGMALENQGDYNAAKAMFEKIPPCGNAKWTGPARQQIERQDGLILQEEHRRNQGR